MGVRILPRIRAEVAARLEPSGNLEARMKGLISLGNLPVPEEASEYYKRKICVRSD